MLLPASEWKNVDVTGSTSDLNGLVDGDRLLIDAGYGNITVKRYDSGSWVDWSLNTCVLKLEGTLGNGRTFEIVLNRSGGKWTHDGRLTGPITGATWTAEEGP